MADTRLEPGGPGAAPAAVPAERRRLRSVDAFRGLVLALMVWTPATGQGYSWLRHSPWDGVTLSDLIFPTFLVTSGISLAFLLKPPTGRAVRLRLVRRVVLLVLIGLVYNAYGTSGWDLSTLRFTGVLQTIGISGGVAAVVVLATRDRRSGRDRPLLLGAAAVGLVTVYGLGLAISDRCAGETSCNPWFALDTAVLGEAHTYQGGQLGFDPEGIAIAIASGSLVLVGYLAGWLVIRTRRQVLAFTPWLVGAGVALVAIGLLVLDPLQAVNKRLFTPAFAAVAAGAALIGFSAVATLFDAPVGNGADRWERVRAVTATPFIALGRNALIVFLLERFLLQTLTMVHVGDQLARDWLLDTIPVGVPGADLVYTSLVLAVIVAVVGVLHHQRRYLAL